MTVSNGYPSLVSYDRDHLRQIGLPLGGIGTGVVSLGGRGNLHDWEIVNRPAKGFDLQQTFFSLYTKSADGQKTATALEGVIPRADYEGARGATIPNHGLPRFRECSFEAAYPFGTVTLSDDDVPLGAQLRAFNPLIPTDSDNSGIPVAILRYVLTNEGDADIEAAVCGSLNNFIGADGTNGAPRGNHNSYREADGLAGIFMESSGVDPDAPQWGTLALTTPMGDGISARSAWANYSWGDSLLDFWDDFSEDGRLEERERDGKDDPTGSLCVSLVVPAKGSAEVTFFLSWHFPNRTTWKESGSNHPHSLNQAGTLIGNYYTTQYADAWEAAAYTAKNLDWLEAETRAFVDAVCASDLPDVVKESALFNLSTLRSQTVFRTPDGFMFGWEGCDDTAGCCFGSCTHVWNYEQATAFLFGGLALGMREVEFNYATRNDGGMSFRVELPLEHAASWSIAAADGQMGCIMKLYRDWQLSGDTDRLRSMWDKARRAMEFCWLPGGWDADKDGVMEGCQHNTMDVEYYGPNPQMGIWYLGALRAMEEMARHLGETDDGAVSTRSFADDCRRLYNNGSAWIDANLFNGDYYEHEIVPASGVDAVLGMLMSDMGAADPTQPVLQLGAGCLVDQLVGQLLAHVSGLGYLVDEDNVKRTLGSIMRFNFKETMYGHFNHMRSYVLNEESALLMATYPRGERPARPFPYYNEVMTGFEYTAAIGMLYEGDIDNGLKCISAIRDRYDGRKRNPFDEAECGHHYARAMVSWAAILALTGFHYSAVDGTIRFAAPDTDRQYIWSSGYAWGSCALSPTGDGACDVEFSVRGGEISFAEFALTGLGAVSFAQGQSLKKGDSLQFQVSA